MLPVLIETENHPQETRQILSTKVIECMILSCVDIIRTPKQDMSLNKLEIEENEEQNENPAGKNRGK